MSQANAEWENELIIPGLSAIDSPQEIYNTVMADYQKESVLPLFATVELRLARSVHYFDDFSLNALITSAIRSELNFLRAVLGEVRFASHVLPPPSDFLRALQDCLDCDRWEEVSDIRKSASLILADCTRAYCTDFPVDEWWLDLPKRASDIPSTWPGFDLADVVIRKRISCVADPEETATFQNQLKVLANDIGTLEKDVERSTEDLLAIEHTLADGLSEAVADCV